MRDLRPTAIVLDADGVIVDWFLGFFYFMASVGIHGVQPYPAGYNMVDIYQGMTRDEIFAYIPRFNTSPAFAKLQYLPGAVAGIERLRASLPGVPFRILTSAGSDPLTDAMRRENLAPLGIDDITVIPLHTSKAPWLERMAPGAVFVEDTPSHAESAVGCGHFPVLLDSPWNVSDDRPGVSRAMNWNEIVEIIEAEFGIRRAA